MVPAREFEVSCIVSMLAAIDEFVRHCRAVVALPTKLLSFRDIPVIVLPEQLIPNHVQGSIAVFQFVFVFQDDPPTSRHERKKEGYLC